MSPRYDVPNAAPEPLRQVQLLVNSADVENGVDWLPDWLAERGAGSELDRARELRDALRVLVLANNGFPPYGSSTTQRRGWCSNSTRNVPCTFARTAMRSTLWSRSHSARCSRGHGDG
jgi:hypothetical protein